MILRSPDEEDRDGHFPGTLAGDHSCLVILAAHAPRAEDDEVNLVLDHKIAESEKGMTDTHMVVDSASPVLGTHLFDKALKAIPAKVGGEIAGCLREGIVPLRDIHGKDVGDMKGGSLGSRDVTGFFRGIPGMFGKIDADE